MPTASDFTGEDLMNQLIADEPDRIPRGDLRQNLYRAAYEQARLNALGAHAEIGPEPEEAHALALRVVRAQFPDFNPELR
jgi:hypothetical protein